jgi:hypothetical protein
MARARLRAVKSNGKLRFRCAVAYALIPQDNVGFRCSALMLTVYCECFKYKSHDNDKCWSKAARMYVPRDTPEADQLAYLNVLCNTAAMRINCDFDIIVEASTKTPRSLPDGIQRPFTE